MEKEITIIEISADSLYLVITGDKKAIDKLVITLNNNTDEIKYMSAKIDVPASIKCTELANLLHKPVTPKSGIETAHCYTYAEENSSGYMIITLELVDDYYLLGYPTFDIGDDGDAEKVMYEWLKRKIHKIPKSIKKTLKPITLVGNKDDILVFTTKIASDD